MVYINECMDVNTALKKFLQIYELFGLNESVSKKFPMLASSRLYLVIFFQIYGFATASSAHFTVQIFQNSSKENSLVTLDVYGGSFEIATNNDVFMQGILTVWEGSIQLTSFY